jgi:hypothetical protein
MMRRRRRVAALQVGRYLAQPGDSRQRPAVPARAIVWSLLAAYLLRDGAFHAVEALARSPARRAGGVARAFGDDTLASGTERVDLRPTRAALIRLVRAATTRKAFDASAFMGLALDGTTVGRCPTARCPACHPIVTAPPDGAPLGAVVG